MKQLLLSLGIVCTLVFCGRGDARAGDDKALTAALLEKVALPILREKVGEIDRTISSETHYGLKGKSVGRNGLREEVDNRDIYRDGEKVSETRYNFLDKFAWAEKGRAWGPPGFQYFVFRHPLTLTFDPKTLEFTLSTKLEFKVAVAINYDAGIVKPWIFADTGFGNEWPNEVDISIKSKVVIDEHGKLSTRTTTHVNPKKPIVFKTLHGLVTKDCAPEVKGFLKGEMDKIAAKFDAEVVKVELNLRK